MPRQSSPHRAGAGARSVHAAVGEGRRRAPGRAADVREGPAHRRASLRITIRAIKLETADANGPPTTSECADLSVRCATRSSRSCATTRARTWLPEGLLQQPDADSPVLQCRWRRILVGIPTPLVHRRGHLVGLAHPVLEDAEFNRTGDVNGDTSGSRASWRPGATRSALNVPLGSVHFAAAVHRARQHGRRGDRRPRPRVRRVRRSSRTRCTQGRG